MIVAWVSIMNILLHLVELLNKYLSLEVEDNNNIVRVCDNI